jgi:hypothetical protein
MNGFAAESNPPEQKTINENRYKGVPAFKEWAIVCDSILRGETSLIFRKGGIAEGVKGFQFKHPHFYLFPTYFHEQIERTRLTPQRDVKQRKDCVAITVFVEIEFAKLLRNLNPLRALESFHVLHPSVLEERFHYEKQNGLHVAFIRAFRISPVWELAFQPAFGGCRSWITLPVPPDDLGKEPVLSDEEQNRRRSIITAALPEIAGDI